MTDAPDDEARRLWAEIDGPAELPPPSPDPAPLPLEDAAPAPVPAAGPAVGGRRRGIAGGVMALAGAAWLGVGAATFAALPCALGGVLLATGLWVVLGSRF